MKTNPSTQQQTQKPVVTVLSEEVSKETCQSASPDLHNSNRRRLIKPVFGQPQQGFDAGTNPQKAAATTCDRVVKKQKVSVTLKELRKI